MGYFFGGVIVFNIIYLDYRIKVGINMDGLLFEVKNRDVINKLFMFIRLGSFKEWLGDFKKDIDLDNEVIK